MSTWLDLLFLVCRLHALEGWALLGLSIFVLLGFFDDHKCVIIRAWVCHRYLILHFYLFFFLFSRASVIVKAHLFLFFICSNYIWSHNFFKLILISLLLRLFYQLIKIQLNTAVLTQKKNQITNKTLNNALNLKNKHLTPTLITKPENKI
jgi:hypothetical protein